MLFGIDFEEGSMASVICRIPVMFNKNYLLFIFLIFCFSVFGCTKTIDNVKEGNAKGFVKFTLEEGKHHPPIGVDIYEGSQKLGFITGLVSLKVAKIPGNYDFSAILSNVNKGISVSIVEGKLTPVKMVYIQRSITRSEIKFDLYSTVDKPRPITEND
jgi:hypothetical protein